MSLPPMVDLSPLLRMCWLRSSFPRYHLPSLRSCVGSRTQPPKSLERVWRAPSASIDCLLYLYPNVKLCLGIDLYFLAATFLLLGLPLVLEHNRLSLENECGGNIVSATHYRLVLVSSISIPFPFYLLNRIGHTLFILCDDANFGHACSFIARCFAP